MNLEDSIIPKAFIVPGNPHILLAQEKSPSWKKLHDAYGEVRKELESVEADLILYFSTQWASVIGHLFQADPEPEWTLVDPNWHEFGSMPYKFKVDAEFSEAYCQELKNVGAQAATVNYRGFPIDTGTVVAQKLLNPDNRLPASMVSCNIYIEKDKTQSLGRGAARALLKTGKKAVVVLVTNLSNRQFNYEIDPKEDRFYSQKDDEWNQKIIELLAEGRLEDVDQCTREFAREAGADMGFKGIWWLNGACGQTNDFNGKLYDYQPVWGAGAALLSLTPTKSIGSPSISGLTEGERLSLGLASDDEDADTESLALKKRERSIQAASVSERDEHTGKLERHDSSTAPEPVGAYPHARRYGDLLLLSGVGPRQRGSKDIPGVTLDSQGNIVDYDVRVQTKSVIENIKTILEEAGSSLEKVVDITVFLTNMEKDFRDYNEVYAEHFKDIGPTRTTLGITALPTPIAVEFKVLARP